AGWIAASRRPAQSARSQSRSIASARGSMSPMATACRNHSGSIALLLARARGAGRLRIIHVERHTECAAAIVGVEIFERANLVRVKRADLEQLGIEFGTAGHVAAQQRVDVKLDVETRPPLGFGQQLATKLLLPPAQPRPQGMHRETYHQLLDAGSPDRR